MSLQQKLFQLYTAMIEMLMSTKYNFMAHLVLITLTLSKLNRKKQLFVQSTKFNILTSSLMKLSESKNKVFYQYMSERLEINYFFSIMQNDMAQKNLND